jgi:hypothetical protein
MFSSRATAHECNFTIECPQIDGNENHDEVVKGIETVACQLLITSASVFTSNPPTIPARCLVESQQPNSNPRLGNRGQDTQHQF